LGESPYACACRETFEEIGLKIGPGELHLTGIVSEHGYQGASHWLMFLFEILPRLTTTPPPCNEGGFEFFGREKLAYLPIPQSDREQIWPLFWKHRRGFFAAHCQCHAGDQNVWTLEQSNPKQIPGASLDTQ
jgi:8-oxo-dGTP diphosphatase